MRIIFPPDRSLQDIVFICLFILLAAESVDRPRCRQNSGMETVYQEAAKETGPAPDSKAEQGSSVSGYHRDDNQRLRTR
jgi:hypothetical protein